MGKVLLAATGVLVATALAACGSDDGGGDGGGSGGGGEAIVRAAAQDLSAEEKRTFTDAVLELKKMPSPFEGYENRSYYDTFVKWHKDAFNCDEETAHMGPNFLPWHRHFLILFEAALEKAAGEPVGIPYWDWTDPESTNAVFRNDLMGGNGDIEKGYALTSGPFRKGEYRLNVLDPKANDPLGLRYVVRQIGTFPSNETLPTERDVDRALTRPEYDVVPFNDQSDPGLSFRNNLEGWRGQIGQKCVDGLLTPLTGPGAEAKKHDLHNGVHLWVGGIEGERQGTMDLNTSLNDPVFWLHHANIDRIWQAWIEDHGEEYEPAGGWPEPDENLNQAMVPFDEVGQRVTPASLLDIGKLGYEYADLPKAESGADGGGGSATAAAVGPPALGFSCAL
ncbi:MAG TPA: tyrosinase family protein [Solirubrobacterales bacterium]